MKSGNLNFLEPSGSLQAFNGSDLPLPLLTVFKVVSFRRRRLFKRKFYYGFESVRNENVLNSALKYNAVRFTPLLLLPPLLHSER